MQRFAVFALLGFLAGGFVTGQDSKSVLEKERDRAAAGLIAPSLRGQTPDAPCPHYQGSCGVTYTHSDFQCVNGLGLYVDVYDITLSSGQNLAVSASSQYIFVEILDSAGAPVAVGDVGTSSFVDYTATSPGNFQIEIVSSYDVTYHLTTACGGGSGSGVNLYPYQPSGWTDKIVVSKAPGTTADSSGLTPSDTLYVDWAVANTGPGSTASTFYTYLFLDGVLKQSWRDDPPFNGNTYSYVQDYSLGSLPAGVHTLRISADYTNTVAESNERDNDYTKTVTIGGGGPPPGTHSVVLPAAASIVGGSPFFSDVRLFNASSTTPLAVTAVYRCFIPSPCNVGIGSIQLTLAPHESKALDDICAGAFASPNSAGGVEFAYNGDSNQLIVSSRLYSTMPFDSVGMFIPGIDSASAAMSTVLTSIRHSPSTSPPTGFRTNVGAFNPGDAATSVTFTIVDGGTAPVGSAVTRTVPAHSGIQVSGIFDAAGASGVSTANAVILVSAGAPVFSYAAVLDNATTDPIFVVGVPVAR